MDSDTAPVATTVATTDEPAGQDCPGTCSATYRPGELDSLDRNRCPECGTLLTACPVCDRLLDFHAAVENGCAGCGRRADALFEAGHRDDRPPILRGVATAAAARTGGGLR